MRILYLAPHPFYAERGTPIATRMMVETLTALGHEVDLLTYHEGEDVAGLRVHRIRKPPGIHNVPIGPSWKKVVCDLWYTFAFLRLALRGRHDLVHAGEEAAFLAYLFRWLHRRPYVVDMDSSIPDQLAERFRFLRPFLLPVRWLERKTLQHAVAVTAVGEKLADIARRVRRNGGVHVIRDVGDLGAGGAATDEQPHRERLEIPAHVPLVLYAGNLQPYQGVDLLLDAFSRLAQDAALVVVGGGGARLEAYRVKTERMGLGRRVHWLGARPLRELPWHLRQADVLVSPRITGDNTPMKIYAYLASGVPVVATRIAGHTEVLDDDVAVLVEPLADAFAAGLDALLADPERRRRIGAAGRALAEARFSRAAFDRGVARLYAEVEERSR